MPKPMDPRPTTPTVGAVMASPGPLPVQQGATGLDLAVAGRLRERILVLVDDEALLGGEVEPWRAEDVVERGLRPVGADVAAGMDGPCRDDDHRGRAHLGMVVRPPVLEIGAPVVAEVMDPGAVERQRGLFEIVVP